MFLSLRAKYINQHHYERRNVELQNFFYSKRCKIMKIKCDIIKQFADN